MEQLISNKELAKELHKPMIKKFKERKIQSLFIGSIWGADVADMQLISKFNEGIRFLLNVLILSVNMHGLLQLLMLFKQC